MTGSHRLARLASTLAAAATVSAQADITQPSLPAPIPPAVQERELTLQHALRLSLQLNPELAASAQDVRAAAWPQGGAAGGIRRIHRRTVLQGLASGLQCAGGGGRQQALARGRCGRGRAGQVSQRPCVPGDAVGIHGALHRAFNDEVVHARHRLSRGKAKLLAILFAYGAAKQCREYVHDPLGPAAQLLAQPLQCLRRTRSKRK